MFARISLISFRLLRPKFFVLSMSCSVRCTSSPMSVMFAFWRQFALRTLSSSSSTRAEEVLVERLVLGAAMAVLRLLGLLEVDEDRELLLQDLRGVGHRVLRLHAAVRPDLERELVVVGLLPDARVGDRVVDLADRREERSRWGSCRSAWSASCCCSAGT